MPPPRETLKYKLNSLVFDCQYLNVKDGIKMSHNDAIQELIEILRELESVHPDDC